MYVWARLAKMAATSGRRGPYQFGGESRLAYRCLPSDIDSNLHVNNARYMMLADIGRIDIFMRSGLLALARQRGWAPMLGGLQTTFLREIRLWQRFEVVSTIETWAGTQAMGRHRFLLKDGSTAALILTTAGIYDRRRRAFVEVGEMMAALGHHAALRPLSPEEQAFIQSHQGLRSVAKG